MGSQTDHLVGRAEELGSLARALAELDQDQSVAVLLVGEPGIGKTRLLTEFGARADAEGHLVLSGSASELERDLPFSLFVDALDEYLRGLAPTHFALLDADVRAELAHVFPSLTALAGRRQVALQDERYRSHRAVRALLEQLASTEPLVLALDDLHWADPASIELLGALLRRPPAAPVLLALATRPRHIPERLAAALERAWRADQITRIELGALSAVEARELLATWGVASTWRSSTSRAVAIPSTSSNLPVRVQYRLGTTRPRSPGSGFRRRLPRPSPRSSRCCPIRNASCWRGLQSPAIRSSPSSPRRRPR